MLISENQYLIDHRYGQSHIRENVLLSRECYHDIEFHPPMSIIMDFYSPVRYQLITNIYISFILNMCRLIAGHGCKMISNTPLSTSMLNGLTAWCLWLERKNKLIFNNILSILIWLVSSITSDMFVIKRTNIGVLISNIPNCISKGTVVKSFYCSNEYAMLLFTSHYLYEIISRVFLFKARNMWNYVVIWEKFSGTLLFLTFETRNVDANFCLETQCISTTRCVYLQ